MTEPLWLSVARAFEGLAEIPGRQSNPVILRWARDIGAPKWYENDDQAWCAVWMNRLAMAMQFPLSGTGYDLLRAKSFATWGQPTPPALGAWMVFARPEGGHVGLYLGERPDAYRVLGGNTQNKVGAAWLAKDRAIATRWPPWIVPPVSLPVWLTDDGRPVSVDEA